MSENKYSDYMLRKTYGYKGRCNIKFRWNIVESKNNRSQQSWLDISEKILKDAKTFREWKN